MKRFLLCLVLIFSVRTALAQQDSFLAQDSLVLRDLRAKLPQLSNQGNQVPPIDFAPVPPLQQKEEAASRIEKIIKKFADTEETTLEKRPVSARQEDARTQEEADLKQFGYDFFQKSPAQLTTSNVPVNSDYILGPGDEFTLTLWGLVEGIYTLKVNKEGNVTLPKAGVIPVAGTRFEDLDDVLRKNLGKYYKDFNLSVAMNNLKNIPVYVTGAVEDPGRYTVSSLATLMDALITAGGPTKQGSLRNIQLKRNGQTETVDLYAFFITGDKNDDLRLEAGDSIFIPIIGDVVAVSGNVTRPAIYEIKGSEKLNDVLSFAGGILPVGSLQRIQVERITGNQKRVMLDLKATPDALRHGERLAYAMSNMDVVKILPIYAEISNKVTVVGTVQHPGDFELKPGMRLKDVLNKGQITPETYLDRVEIVRTDPETLERQIITASFRRLMAGDSSENIALKSRDLIYVFTEERGEYKVQLKGEVNRPGEYVVRRGERLASLLQRAGGFTDAAYPQGVIFTRQRVMDQQKLGMEKSLQQLELSLARKEASKLPGLSAETADIQNKESENLQTLVKKMREVKPEGRIVISLSPDLDKFESSPDNINLNDGDYIEIPERPDTVIVLGSVFNPSAITWKKGATVGDYLKEVGGLTKSASRREVHVFKMNGKVLSSRYYAINHQELEPGDIINVPEKIRKPGQSLFTFKDLAQIVFNLGTTAALFVAAFH